MSWTSPPPYPLFNIDTTSNSTTIDADEHSSSSSHSSSSPFQNLKPSILVIILILSITLLVSLSLCLLLRLLNRRCLRHLSPSSTSSSTTHLHSSVRVSPHVSDSSPSVLDSLPLFTFGSIKRRSSAADCAVCLSKFESHDQLRLLPLCCHAFHASCIDTWLLSNQTCPLCRSPIHASDSDLIKALSSANTGDDSFRLEIGSVSRRRTASDFAADHAPRSSYSIGSFEYVVEEESEINMSHTHRRSVSDKDISGALAAEEPVALATEVASGRSWLKDYVDRLSASLSSRSLSFRSSGRFMGGSCRRSEVSSAGDYDLEASRAGEEISEFFRWFSGV